VARQAAVVLVVATGAAVPTVVRAAALVLVAARLASSASVQHTDRIQGSNRTRSSRRHSRRPLLRSTRSTAAAPHRPHAGTRPHRSQMRHRAKVPTRRTVGRRRRVRPRRVLVEAMATLAAWRVGSKVVVVVQ